MITTVFTMSWEPPGKQFSNTSASLCALFRRVPHRQVGDPMSYQRESWLMEKDEKMRTVPLLHMQGNSLVKMKRYEDAASKYKEAVLLLKVVQSRVSDWNEVKMIGGV